MLGGTHCGNGQSVILVLDACTLAGDPGHPHSGKHPRCGVTRCKSWFQSSRPQTRQPCTSHF